MTLTAIIILIILGLLLLLLEFLVIPGTTIAGIGGFILIATGIYFSYKQYDQVYGHIILASTLVIAIIGLVISLRGGTWNRIALHSEIKGKVNTINSENIKIGDTGLTITRLAPIGKVLFNEEEYEAKSHGEFIDHNKEIEIIKILPNQLIVKLKTE